MTVSTLRPSSTVSTTGTVTATGGAGTAHGNLSDDTDASYITLDPGEAVLLGLTDLTLPAGAVIKQIAERTRTLKVTSNGSLRGGFKINSAAAGGGDTLEVATIVISWTTATTTTFKTVVLSYTDSDADGARIHLENVGAYAIRIHEAYLDATYVTQPVATVTAPTGTLTEDNTPPVTWTNTLDAAGGAQTSAEVKVFSAAQYGIGGFDPATSPNTWSGTVTGAALTKDVTTALPNATYRAYVRTAQTVNGVSHWSAWAFSGFIISTPAPDVPTITATANSANGRNTIVVTEDDSPVTTDYLELERSIDGGTTWEALRTLDSGKANTGTLHDYEAPNGVGVAYRARSVHVYAIGLGISAWSYAQLQPIATGPNERVADEIVAVDAANGALSLLLLAVPDAATGTVVDRGPSAHTATLTNGASVDANGALSLDGANDYVATNLSPFVAGSVRTFVLLVNPDTLATEDVLFGGSGANHPRCNISTTAISFDSDTSSSAVASASVATTNAVGETILLGITVDDAANLLTVYRNGVLVGTATMAEPYGAAPGTLQIGTRGSGAGPFDGLMGPVAVISGALTAAEHERLARAAEGAAWEGDVWWLKHPTQPSLNRTIDVFSQPGELRPAPQGRFRPLGSRLTVVVFGQRGGPEGEITFDLTTDAEKTALIALLETNDPLLVQAPADHHWADRWVAFGDLARQRHVDKLEVEDALDSLSWIEVARPEGDVVAWPA